MSQGEPRATGSSGYITTVPDHHDRIIWRNRYYHLESLVSETEATYPTNRWCAKPGDSICRMGCAGNQPCQYVPSAAEAPKQQNFAGRLRSQAAFLAANYNDLSNSEAQVIVRAMESAADHVEAYLCSLRSSAAEPCNDVATTLKEVEDTIWQCTGTALLAGEKHKPSDPQVVYRMLCEAGNKVAYVRDLLTRTVSATRFALSDEEIDDLMLDLDLHAVHPCGAIRLDAARERVRAWLANRSDRGTNDA